MQPNPVLKKLGFTDHDRLVIIHTDDIGMCQASVAAFADLQEFGLISSGAVMAPCAWFPHAAAYCRDHPGVDMGVHLTLNSEWDAYRWGPLSTRDSASGLMDADGYFHHRQPATQEQASPEAVLLELQTQVQRALQAGIDVTHVDTHMGTVAHPKFIPAYIQVALEQRLPVLISRQDEAGYQALGMDAETAAFAVQAAAQLEQMGLPLLDHMTGLDLDKPDERLEQAKQAMDALPAGVTHFVIHPSLDTPELRAIAPDWRSRVADYQTFSSPALRDHIRNAGIHITGYRALRDLMRAQ